MKNPNPIIFALVPARGGSKGLPRKNLQQIAGRSLVNRAIDAGLQCTGVSRVFVSTDDQEIADHVRDSGAGVIMRPPELAADASLILDTITHAIQEMRARIQPPDALMLLEPTSPLRKTETLNALVVSLRRAESCFTVSLVEPKYHPRRQLVVSDSGVRNFVDGEKFFSNRQEMIPTYVRNGVGYICRTSLIERDGVILNDKSEILSIDYPTVSIDSLADLRMAELLLKEF